MDKVIRLIVILTPLVFAFGQLTKIPLNIPGINLYLYDLLIFVSVLIWFFKAKPDFKQLKKHSLTKPILLFAVLALVSLILASFSFTPKKILFSSFYLIRWLIYAAWYWVLLWLFKKDKGFKKKWLKTMIGAISLFALFGLIQYFVWPDMRPLKSLGWDDHRFRLVSTFLDPGYTGIHLVLGLIMASHYFPIVLPFLYLSLALTYSRASYLAFLAGMFVLAIGKKNKKLFIAIPLFLLLTVLILPRPHGEGVRLERTTSSLARVNNWQQSLELAKEKPAFGYGFNSLRYVLKSAPASHSAAGVDASLLFVLLTTGAIGLTAYLYFLKKSWQKSNLIFKASLISLLIHSFFNNSLFYAPAMFWFWSLAAQEKFET